MVFSSSVFLFVFLPVVFFFYFLSAPKYQNLVLLIASLFFYAWGEPKNIVLMLVSILVNYIAGFLVAREWKWKKFFLVVAVAYDLGMLFVFKYLNFTVNVLNRFAHMDIQIRQIALPIGISFYTFQIMSYVIDVYRGTVKTQQSILNLALYLSLFPQLIAGPIVRYVDVEKQITCRQTTWEKARYGAVRFAIGFAKKILIADQLSPLVAACFEGKLPSVWVNWIGAVAYTLQIYFDFSGYSDMAIGLGKIFGFDFLENFNYPYISQTVQEFWRRWHISLGSWFRDYVYIPLGGSRHGKVRTYLNYIIVFFLTGFWHGASFNFIFWGLYYVVFLIAERMGWRKVLEKLPRFVRHLYCLFVIVIGWVFFRADSLGTAFTYVSGMFRPSGSDLWKLNYIMNRQYWFVLAVGVLLCVPWRKITGFFGLVEQPDLSQMPVQKVSTGAAEVAVHKTQPGDTRHSTRHPARTFAGDMIVMGVFMLAMCYMVGSGYSPFLYFRF